MLIVDLSNNNPEPDWKRFASQNIRGVFLKASEGTSFTDGTFAARRTNANRAGLRVGAYHFARPDASEAVVQAHKFVSIVQKLGTSDLRPVLDFEAASKLSPAALVLWARAWNKVVWTELGTLPLFYTYSSYAQSLQAKTPIGAGLWLASYNRNDGTEHPFVVPAPWKSSVAHQFSSRCTVGGCSGLVDLSDAKSFGPILAHPFGWF